MFEVIKSKDNKTIKEIKKLKEKRYRVALNRFIVEGFRFVTEAIESSFNVPYVILNEASEKKFIELGLDKKISSSTKVLIVPEVIFRTICSTDTPQGIAAVAENAETSISFEDGFYILVDKVQDPGNMGTIIRTANAAGAKGVILTKGTVDIYNDKTLRSTMGSIFKIPIILDETLDIVYNLKANGFKLVVSSLDTENNFYDIDLKDKVIIAVGNEGNGISDEIYALANERVKIPMPGNAESLNVGVAAAIMMFEVVRQKNT